MRCTHLRQPPLVSAVVAFTLLLLAALTATAQEPPAEPRAARLIQRLGSDRYQDRAEATSELAKLGTTSRRQLEAAAQSADPEVRLRAGELLQQLRTLDLWAPSIVDCRMQSTPVSHVVARLVEQSGNHVRIGDFNGKFNDRNVNLNFAAGSFWQVLDEACRQSNNRVRSHYDTREPGFLLIAGPASTAPTAYAGPFRAQITRLVRTFSDRLDFGDDGPQRIHSFELDVQMMWEDRFRLVGFRPNPEVVEAITSTGEQLTPVQGIPGNWQSASASTKQIQSRISLSPPPVAAQKLDRLTLRWNLMAVGEMKQLVVDELAASHHASPDGVELTIDSMERRDRDRFEISCVVARDIALPDPAEIIFQEYRLEVQDSEGRAWRTQSPSCLLTSRGVQIRTTLLRDGEQGDPKSLVLHYPAIRSERAVELSFVNVPVPHARPD